MTRLQAAGGHRLQQKTLALQRPIFGPPHDEQGNSGRRAVPLNKLAAEEGSGWPIVPKLSSPGSAGQQKGGCAAADCRRGLFKINASNC
jgi:hypothetical protein